jgi:putative redox protein
MTTRTNLTWKENLAFEAEVNGFKFMLDTGSDTGGTNLGPRPKPLLLAAMSGCSGMDTVSILKKMRITDYKLQINMEAEQSDEHPKIYQAIRMTFEFTGIDLPQEKVINAVELSINKYCAVYAMLKFAAKITTKIKINNKEVWNA